MRLITENNIKNNENSVSSAISIRLKQLESFSCDICKEEFYSQIHYQIHSIIHLLPEYLNCNECQEIFAHISNLDNHLATHKNSVCMVCHVCKKEFFDAVSLNKHVKIHTTDFPNTLIAQTGNEENYIKIHDIQKYGSYHNEGCEKYALEKQISCESLQNHFKCDTCNKGFPEKNLLDEHYQSDCLEKQLMSEADEKLKSLYGISKSNFPGSDGDESLVPDALDLNEGTTSSGTFQISEDVKLLTSEASEQQDEKTNVCSKNPRHIKKLTSEVCQKMLPNKQSLIFHISTHSEENTFSCQLCDKKFALKSLLDVHLQVHEINKFSCGVCHEYFASKDDLFNHVYIHAMDKPFSCDTCEMAFPDQSSFAEHRFTHPPKKKLRKKVSCEVCQKVLSCKATLEGHMSIHTGLRPHVCKICSKAFSCRQNLFRHSLIHAGKKQFQCETCGMSFNRKASFIKHQLTHQQVGTKKRSTEGNPCHHVVCVQRVKC